MTLTVNVLALSILALLVWLAVRGHGTEGRRKDRS
jgi:hypothetical protein